MDRRPKALVVDDEVVYCDAMRLVLEAAGADVFVANDAFAAETLFRLVVPDIVILDVMMPGMSGLDLIPRLHAFVGWERVPVIVASALGMKLDRERALNAGADAYLVKPFSSRELRSMVGQFLPLAQTGRLPPAA